MASVGILIIGSLFWRKDPIREEWRGGRLDLTRQFKVKAPIRYGRLSRSNTYTMVFSRECQKRAEGLGQAIVVPCQTAISSIHDLRAEAEELWKAERNQPSHGRIFADWGAVALLPNPNHHIPPHLIDDWRKLGARPKLHYTTDDDKPSATEDGMLDIDWPNLADGSGPVDLDLLLATATNPCLLDNPLRYATPTEIALAWNTFPDQTEYFRNNLLNGIFTFQDQQIQSILN